MMGFLSSPQLSALHIEHIVKIVLNESKRFT